MESEEYYDSLDESSDYESWNYPEYGADSSQHSAPALNRLEDGRDDLVPFYDGNLCLNQLDLSKHSSRCSGFLAKNTSSRSKMKISITPEPKPKKSYLEIFYNKSGKHLDMNECDSSRAACSNRSGKSYVTCDGDIECDKVTTVDFKSDSEPSINSDKALSLRPVPELNLSRDSGRGDNIKFGDYTRFYSVSEQNMEDFISSSINYKCNKKRPLVLMASKSTNTTSDRLDMVKAKLEAWKKRQEYGMRASESNRIKLQEKRTLQLLGKDLKNSYKA